MPTPAASVKILPYMMARIVELQTFLKSIHFNQEKRTYSLEIEDSYGPWNEGIWTITIDEQGKATVTKVLRKRRDCCFESRYPNVDATILGLSFSRDVIFYERARRRNDSSTFSQRLVKGMPILEDYF